MITPLSTGAPRLGDRPSTVPALTPASTASRSSGVVSQPAAGVQEQQPQPEQAGARRAVLWLWVLEGYMDVRHTGTMRPSVHEEGLPLRTFPSSAPCAPRTVRRDAIPIIRSAPTCASHRSTSVALGAARVLAKAAGLRGVPFRRNPKRQTTLGTQVSYNTGSPPLACERPRRCAAQQLDLSGGRARRMVSSALTPIDSP